MSQFRIVSAALAAAILAAAFQAPSAGAAQVVMSDQPKPTRAEVGLSQPRAGGLPKALVKSRSKKFRVRPGTIRITSKFIIGKPQGPKSAGFLEWHTWTGQRAFGRARFWIDDGCMDCGGFKYRSYKGSVTLSQPRNGKFTVLILRHTGAGGGSEPYVLMRKNGKWIWGWENN